jgi:hypothetical protein
VGGINGDDLNSARAACLTLHDIAHLSATFPALRPAWHCTRYNASPRTEGEPRAVARSEVEHAENWIVKVTARLDVFRFGADVRLASELPQPARLTQDSTR